MTSEIGITTLVISDLDRFSSMRDFWDQELKDHVDDPFFFSCMLIEHWKFSQRIGLYPFLMVFLSSDKIVGFALLKMRSSFGFRYVTNIDPYMCPDFFSDNYREVCIERLISFLFRQLNCASADITFEDESANQRMLERVCRKKDFNYTRVPSEGKAIIPVTTSVESFRQSLNRKVRKEFRRVSRKLDKLGSWQISCFDLDRGSLAKVWAIEKFSWKANLKGKAKAMKDLGLDFILKGIQRNSEAESFFESKVWTLELNDVPIAYVLAMKRNKTVFFAKTSYDSRFREVSPGTFLMNDLIERVFRTKSAEKIDFISNLPVVRIWKPLVEKRITFDILRNAFSSKTRRLVFENRISQKSLKILERFSWEKRAR